MALLFGATLLAELGGTGDGNYGCYRGNNLNDAATPLFNNLKHMVTATRSRKLIRGEITSVRGEAKDSTKRVCTRVLMHT